MNFRKKLNANLVKKVYLCEDRMLRRVSFEETKSANHDSLSSKENECKLDYLQYVQIIENQNKLANNR